MWAMSINSTPESNDLISGIVACPGGVHVWPNLNSHANHSFGAAAERDPETDDVMVTLYTDIRGKRAGELRYPAEVWDKEFIEDLRVAARQGVEKVYTALD